MVTFLRSKNLSNKNAKQYQICYNDFYTKINLKNQVENVNWKLDQKFQEGLCATENFYMLWREKKIKNHLKSKKVFEVFTFKLREIV